MWTDSSWLVNGSEGILGPFLFLLHQLTIISSSWKSWGIIHSSCVPHKPAESCTAVRKSKKKKKTAANLKNSSCVLHQHNDLSWTVKFEHCGIAGRTDREENRRIGWRENSPRFSHLIRRRRPMPPPASLPSPLPLHRPPLLPATATPVLHLAGARLLVTVAALVMTAAAEPERRPSPARRRERCRGSQRDTETDRWGPQKRVDRSQSRPISLCPGNLRRMGHNCGPDMSYNGPLLRRTFPDGTV